MKTTHLTTIILIFAILLSWPASSIAEPMSLSNSSLNARNPYNQPFAPAASTGIGADLGSYLIVHEIGMSVDSHGIEIQKLLESKGVVVDLIQASDLLLDRSPLSDAIAIICDGSLGSDNGTSISQALIDLLVWADKPTILLGQSAWLLHSFKEEGPPQLTAPASLYIYSSPAYAGAVFLNSPNIIVSGSAITSESLLLPIDRTQSEHSRLVNLTLGTGSSVLAPLRYDSYPLDSLLIGLEDPTQWTGAGENLLLNALAYSTTLSESVTTRTLAQRQSASTLEGGFTYYHEGTIESAYFAITSLYSILDSVSWTNWVSENGDLVKSLLDSLYVDLGSEAGFMDSRSGGSIGLRSTSQGIWIANTMGIASSYNSTELTSYLSSRQSGDGGFGNILTTYYVTQALSVTSTLNQIDTGDLETWLRDCVITGSDTPDPNKWGGVAYSPATSTPQNNYATRYLLSLSFLGLTHDDPVKLTNWILSRTANGDGSFDNTLSTGSEPVTGTASALTSLELLGTLSPSNITSGVEWIARNQLGSGGFGISTIDIDIIAKTEETSNMAICLGTIDITNETILDGIVSYMNNIKSPAGFEGMESEPSLMWNYWILESTRYAHAGSSIDQLLAEDYLNFFTTWAQYPTWPNITAYISPEYSYLQYNAKGVWTQYFGSLAGRALGINTPSSIISETVNYLEICQYITGHYRPTSFSGTAHMQNTVAAIETLYLLDSLDSINYLSALQTAVMSEYSSGTWDSSGWTINPFTNSQAAIDWLSTRTALRLNLVDSTMASEIAASIEGRVQYDDLWALSRDVATLALLNSSFPVSLEAIDESLVLSALNSVFSDGWFNSSIQWQPIYTQGVLEMISILGIRPDLQVPSGSSCSISIPSEVSQTSTISISISISSGATTHTAYVFAFDEWIQFDDVGNSDVLSISIPTSPDALGLQNISVMIWDYNASRSYSKGMITVLGSLDGSLDVATPSVLLGDLINGTISWTLESGSPTGNANLSIRLENLMEYQEWYYVSSSPLDFEIPTSDFDPGVQNLTVTIDVADCESLVLAESVYIFAPNPTYIESVAHTTGEIGEQISIPWSLLFQENDSYVLSNEVSIIVRNSSNDIVYSASQFSTGAISYFNWTPLGRGNYTFTLEHMRNGTIERCVFNGEVEIFEATSLSWIANPIESQYDSVTFVVHLEDTSSTGLGGYPVNIQVIAPNLTVVYDGTQITNSSGYISIELVLSSNGNYTLEAIFDGSGFLYSSSATDQVIAWSDSVITVGGLNSEGLVNTTWTIWFDLHDAVGYPIVGESVDITITYLPSTIVYETTLTTNGTGGGSLQWIADSPGSYLVEVAFSGTSSRQTASDSISGYLRIPVTLSMVEVSSYKVGQVGWCQIQATNHESEMIHGLEVEFVVRDPSGAIFYQTTVITTNGLVNVSWIPGVRGVNMVYISADRTSFYEAAAISQEADVYDQSITTISVVGDLVAISSIIVRIEVTDSQVIPVEGISVHTIVSLNGIEILDTWSDTSPTGIIQLPINLTSPGDLVIDAIVTLQDWLFSSSEQESLYIKGRTSLDIDSNGLPISQGSTVGYLAHLLDWQSSPISGATIVFQVVASNGSILRTATRTTGIDGTCAFAYTFNVLGDFIIRANYSGTSANAPSTHQLVQRVNVNPILLITHSPTSLYGTEVEVQIGIRDAFGALMPGLSLRLTISFDGDIVFDSQTPSSTGLVVIHWTPEDRGQATLALSYVGSTYILPASNSSVISILEQVSGALTLSDEIIDLGNQTSLSYQLSASGDLFGVEIEFQILDYDLVPIWTTTAYTNGSGIAAVLYTASGVTGVLTLSAVPVEAQFLIGGDTQDELIVMSYCHTTSSLLPAPASLGGPLNITISCTNDLGGLIDGLSIRVYLYYLGQPIKLGYLTDWITVVTNEGIALVEFTPQYSGSYQVILQSSGSVSIHPMSYSAYHIVHNPTSLEFVVLRGDIEVGDSLEVTARLSNYYGNPMVGHTIWLSVDGLIAPVNLVTNDTGYIQWTSIISVEGQWSVVAEFLGVGVYLPVSIEDEIDVRYGTEVSVARIDNATLIAGQVDLSVAVLLEDTDGNPLEGRTIWYQVYHDDVGFLFEDSFVQTGQSAEVIDILLDRMGDYTIIFAFVGTDHYHPSSSAIAVFVLGTSRIIVDAEPEYDRSSSENVTITLLDESDVLLNPEVLSLELTLDGISIGLSQRVVQFADSLAFNITGLSVGSYRLHVSLDSTSYRIGTSLDFEFNITTAASIIQSDSSLSGLIGQPHVLSIEVRDSMSILISDAKIFVSIYNPDGQEIYGSILSTRTLVVTGGGCAEIEWTPTKTGNYTILIEFESTNYIDGTSLTLIIEMRYETHMDVTMPESLIFPDHGRLMVTLSGGIGKVTGAEIFIHIQVDGNSIEELTLSTDVRGLVQTDIYPTLAGNMTIVIEYRGSGVYAACIHTVSVLVQPLAELTISTSPNFYSGMNGSITVDVDIQGLDDEWIGTLNIQVYDYLNNLLRNYTTYTSATDQIQIQFWSTSIGFYTVVAEISQVPVLGSVNATATFAISDLPLSIPMDGSSTTVMSSGILLGIIGFALRRRLGGALENVSVEWDI